MAWILFLVGVVALFCLILLGAYLLACLGDLVEHHFEDIDTSPTALLFLRQVVGQM